MRASVQPAFEYQLDPHDVVVSVSDDWLAFARENGAGELNVDSVIGKSLWIFIPDEPTRTFYQGIFGTVRATDKPVVVPFRCDSPTLRRFMGLEVRHRPGCGIDLKSILDRVEPCERRVLLDVNALESSDCLTMCSCCKNVLIEPVEFQVPLADIRKAIPTGDFSIRAINASGHVTHWTFDSSKAK